MNIIPLRDRHKIELEIATIVYRAIHRRPDLYSDQERSFWTFTLAAGKVRR